MKIFIALLAALSAVAAKDLPNLGVIGGSTATLGQFPYQVSIQMNRQQHCGGTLLSPNIVLTAGHCVYQRDTSAMIVIAGTVNRNSGGYQAGISRVSIHSQYDPSVNAYDAAIIFLDASFEFGSDIKAAQLPAEGDVLYNNAVATVSGWGSEYHQGIPSYALKYVSMPLWSRETCLQYVPYLPRSHLCAGDLNGQRNSCPGDSGGPLTSGGKLIGVVSGGFGCGAPQMPGLYTYVAGIRAWIRQITQL